jgi:hypothetical protein
VSIDGEAWWPVQSDTSADALEGYVWGGGINAADGNWRQRLDDVVRGVTSLPANGWERIKDVPGRLLP